MMICKERFGKTSNGEVVYRYSLTASDGSKVSVLSYGATIQKILVPNKYGDLVNVVLGFDDLSSYEKAMSYYGATIGRCAGRIANSSFELGGTSYELSKNDDKFTLHGGFAGFDKKIFTCNTRFEKGKAILDCDYLSPDMEEGFPGNLKLRVSFTFDENKNLEIRYTAISDKDTYLNITNHSYFNLSGKFSKIYDEKIFVNADEMMSFDDSQVPIGFEGVSETLDFRTAKKIGDSILHPSVAATAGVDHIFKLNKDKDIEVALLDESSGIKLEVETSEKAAVIYTQNFLDEKIDTVYDDIKIANHSAVCVETQYFANAMNISGYERVLKASKIYDEYTVYKFGII